MEYNDQIINDLKKIKQQYIDSITELDRQYRKGLISISEYENKRHDILIEASNNSFNLVFALEI